MNDKYLIKLHDYVKLLDENYTGDEWINSYNIITDHNKDLLAVDIGNKIARLMPGPEFAPFLYRGQNKYWEPCVPSLFRSSFLSAQGHDHIRFAINWMKTHEFLFVIYQHPAIEDLQNSSIACCKFEVNPVALLQHYGFSTQYLDFTRDESIAKFFAYCIYDEENDSFAPILNFDNYEPVLYKIELRSLYENKKDALEVVGFQGLKRPDRQKSFCLEFRQKYDLNKFPDIMIQHLPKDTQESIRIFEKFDGGKDLLPDEILDRKAFAIKNDKCLIPEVVDFYSETNHLSRKEMSELKYALKDYNYTIENKSLYLTQQERKSLFDTWNAEKVLLNKRIGIRYCADSV